MGEEVEVTQELLDKARNHDEISSNLIYKGFYKLIHYLCRKWAGKIWSNDYSMQEELFSISHVAYMKALNSFDPLKGVKFATYLSRCVENEILMYYRKWKKIKHEVSFETPVTHNAEGHELFLSDLLESKEDGYDDLEFREGLWKEFKEFDLGSKYGNLLNLSIIEGKTQVEIRDSLGVSQSYVSRLVKKQTIKFKKHLEQVNIIEGGDRMHKSTYTQEQKDRVKYLLENTIMLQQNIAKETGVNQSTVSIMSRKLTRPEGAFRTSKKEEVLDGEVTTTFWSKDRVAEHFGEEIDTPSTAVTPPLPDGVLEAPLHPSLQEMDTSSKLEDTPTIQDRLVHKDNLPTGATIIELVRDGLDADSLEWEVHNLVEYLRRLKPTTISVELKITF